VEQTGESPDTTRVFDACPTGRPTCRS